MTAIELSDMEAGILEQFETLLRIGRKESEAHAQLARMGISEAVLDRVVLYRTQLAEAIRFQALDGPMVWDPEAMGKAWYTGESENDEFWPALKAALLADPKWQGAVDSLDATSRHLVGQLDSPHEPLIQTRGLVIGYVQSGKTASFTSMIAKAADAGYRLFIVLSGVHNALRRQTQVRLDQQLHDLAPKRWLALTHEDTDFGNPVKALALVAGTDLRLLAVVKKNASRLRRLRDWLHAAHEEGGFETCPILIIDDEADQASPNAARNPDLDRTAINKLIVEILRLPRVAYVGYTATPFANVLIDPSPLRDLYPGSFIYSLPKPEGYFGTEELFSSGLSEDEVTTTYNMVRIIPDDEAEAHRIPTKSNFEPIITPCLDEAIRWFILATAARRVRESRTAHSSMLVHTSQRVAAHFSYLPLVKSALKDYRHELESDADETFRELWERETVLEPATKHGLETVDYDTIRGTVLEVLSDVQVVVDNGSSAERLLYDDDAATTVVAIGGNTLSRGLTLEGLICSYFLRGGNAYDTLLQMGRWFGYRPGYGDLPRVWTTAELIDSFRHLADVEHEIRQDVERYAAEKTTPRDAAVRIRLHPRMQITSRLRMQYAVPAESSFSGQRPQTIHFLYKDKSVIDRNLAATRAFIEAARATGVPDADEDRLIVRDIPSEMVQAFLSAYTFHEKTEMQSEALNAYIKKQNDEGELRVWNVAIITRGSDAKGTENVGWSKPVNLIERSRFREQADPATAYIGTLMSKPDRVIDLPIKAAGRLSHTKLLDERTASGRGLLLLYPIAAGSEPRLNKDDRVSMDAAGTLIGVAVSFPRAPETTTAADRVQVDLSRVPVEPFDIEGEPEEVDYVDEDGEQNDIDLGGQ